MDGAFVFSGFIVVTLVVLVYNSEVRNMNRVKEKIMNITGFRPLVVSQEAKTIVEAFEDLGFERKHTKTDIEGGKNTNYTLKDSNGNCINIASSVRVPQDLTSISINVDDFDEAYEFFISHGFKNPRGDKVTETSSSVDVYLIAPSGYGITLTQHIITGEGDE